MHSDQRFVLDMLEAGASGYLLKDCAFDERSYCAITQSARVLDRVKASIRILMDSPVEHEFRLTVVPSYHGAEEILQVARDLNGASRLRIQNFNPASVLDPSLQSLKPFDDVLINSFQRQVDDILAH